jgi:Integrase zinc binding domain/Integrase core domain
MDPEHYDNIFKVLTSQPLLNLSQKQVLQIQKKAKHFIVRNNFLYKIDRRKERNFLRVVRKYELDPILYMFHNDPTAAHFATDTMFEKLRTRYYWPQMYEDIRNYVRSCDECQRRGKFKKSQLLHPIPVDSPFHRIGIDFVGPLPITEQGNQYIIVAMDYLTKWPEAKPVPRATAEATATFLYNDIIGRHGCPSEILSDQGRHFKNNMIAQLTEKFQIRHQFATPYHPQTNGLVERFNRTLKEALAKLSNEHKNNWDQYIAPVLFAYRTAKHSSTKMTPFYLVYGREAKLPMDNLEISGEANLITRVDNLVNDLPSGRINAREQIAFIQQKQKELYDRKIGHVDKFRVGQKVLYYKAAQDNQHTGKLLPKWKGPYVVHHVGTNGSYRLKTLDDKLLKSAVNGNLLKAYYERL